MTEVRSVPFFKVQCASCEHTYLRPLLPDMSYGEFVPGTNSGAWTYLDALAEPAFEQIRELCTKLLPGLASGSRDPRAISSFQRVVAHLADSVGGSRQEMLGVCPRCQSIGSWSVSSGPVESRAVPATTFKHFTSLSESERLAAVQAALQDPA